MASHSPSPTTQELGQGGAKDILYNRFEHRKPFPSLLEWNWGTPQHGMVVWMLEAPAG